MNVIFFLEGKCQMLLSEKNSMIQLTNFSIFGFASLFSVLPRYGIYESRCEVLSEKIISDDTKTITTDCRKQIDEYQVGDRMIDNVID